MIEKKSMTKYLKKIVFPLILLLVAVFILDVGCPIRRLTGIPCPGCGMTRACLAAVRLDFAEAFRMHPLWFLIVPLLLLTVLHPGQLFKSKRTENLFWGALTVLVVGVYLVRMLLLFPHTAPMDYDTGALFCRLWKFLSDG